MQGPLFPNGCWCTSHGKRLELPEQAAVTFALEARRKYPDHVYAPRRIPVEALSLHRAHLVRAAIAAAAKVEGKGDPS